MERRSKHRQPCTVNPLVSLSLLSFLVLLRHALPPEPTSGLPPSPAAIVSNTTVAAPQAHALRSASTPTPPWPKPLVIVPAVWKEWDRGLPHWAREDASPLWSVFAYQRRDPSKPRFAPNFGYEGAIYLRFIVDHYDALPDYSVFIQADMPDGGDWLYWISCLNSSTQFMALPNEFVLGRDSEWGRAVHRTSSSRAHVHCPPDRVPLLPDPTPDPRQ